MSVTSQRAIPAHAISDDTAKQKPLTYMQAEQLFNFFKTCPLFRWADVNNNCEDRAEAICILLEEWGISNYKGWVLSGCLLKKGPGSLRNNWSYHVAALIPVMENNEIGYYIIDPATSDKLQILADWASSVTEYPLCYYVLKHGGHYIFKPGKIKNDNWFERNRQNYKWTMQGLSGINGLSPAGKAYLCFNKNKIKKTDRSFEALKKAKPLFLL